MLRCPHCQGQVFEMERLSDDLAGTDTVRACLQCSREYDPPPPPPPVKRGATTWQRRR